MELIAKPKPNDAYFRLDVRRATRVALEQARDYGRKNGTDLDWQIFGEFTRAYENRKKVYGPNKPHKQQ